MSITKLKEARKSKKNNDGNLANNYPPYDKVTRGDVIAGRLGKDQMGGKRKFTSESKKPNDGNLANNYPPYDKVTRGDVIAGALGQDQMGGKRKKKTVKEGYSNWREDLSEVMEVVNKDQNEKQIKEKKVNNKVVINPSIKEAVENLGGTLLEFTETEDVCILEDLKKLEIMMLDDELLEEVVYEFFVESLEEGYSVDEIEFCILESIETSLSYLTEEEDSKKRGILGSIKGFVKGAAKKLAKGVGYAAGLGVRAVKGTGREIASGYKRGRHGAGSETKSEPTSSSSERPSTETRVRDTAKDGVRKGLRRTLSNWAAYARHKLDPEHGKPSAAHAKGPRTQKLRSGIGGGKRIEVAGRKKETEPEVQRVSVREVPQKPSEVHSRKGTRKAQPYSAAYKAASDKTTPRLTGSSGESTSETKPSTPPSTPKRTRRPTAKTGTAKVTPTQASTPKRTKKAKTASSNADPTGGKLDDLLKSLRSEEYQLDEKKLTSAEKKKQEEIVKSMKDRLSDFEKRYPGRGKEVMYATATKMAKKIAEQALEIQPKQPTQQTQPQKPVVDQSAINAAKKAKSAAVALKTRELQTLRQTPAGTNVPSFGG